MTARDVHVFYGEKEALKGVGIDIHEDRVTAFIGPSGCGKSTFLRCLNRMNDTIPSARVTGEIELDGQNINSAAMDVVQLRARVGMVFQKPNPFPKSIYENVAYGPQHPRARQRARASWTRSSRSRSSAPACGTRSRTASRKAAPLCRAGSSSGCASRARSRSIPRSS